MYDLPPECPATMDHALLHLQNITNASKEKNQIPDIEQLYHDAFIAFQIISNIQEQVNDDKF